MIVDKLVNDLSVGLFHARMLTLLRSTFPQQALDFVLRQELTNGFQSVYYPPTNNTVGVYYGGDNTRKIMYLDGVSTNAQATSIVGGYSATLGLQIINSANTWIQANLPFYLGVMTGGHLQDPEYIDFVGHSAGGAIAEVIAWDMRRRGDLHKKKIFTYGAPRPGGPNVRDGLASVPLTRYMTPADPIPLVPPRLQDAPLLASFLPVSVMLSWSNMVHPRGGVVIYPDGRTTEVVEPPEGSVTAATSLANWYFEIEGAANNQHAMPFYVSCLSAANDRASTPAQKKIEVAAGEQPAELKRRDVNRARERVVNQVANMQREQNNQIVNQPAIVLFRPVRQGRIWTVVFGDKVVCQGVREDTCRHLCRAGNDFLKSLPKQGIVDPISLAAQMENFLLFATSPDSDWIPKLQTKLAF